VVKILIEINSPLPKSTWPHYQIWVIYRRLGTNGLKVRRGTYGHSPVLSIYQADSRQSILTSDSFSPCLRLCQPSCCSVLQVYQLSAAELLYLLPPDLV